MGPGTALHVNVSRVGDRAALDVVGRVRRSSSEAPVAFRVLGRRDVAAPCPTPTVLPSSVLDPPTGSVRVGWRAVSGPRPGVALQRGAVFRSRGTVAIPNDAALRLCVHLVRAGSAALVLRTERVVVPSASMMTPLSVALDPIRDAAVPWLRGLLALGLAAVAILVLRRPLASLRPWWSARRLPTGWRSGGATVRSWLTSLRGDGTGLPPLPPGLRVPDAPPVGAPRGPATGSGGRQSGSGSSRPASPGTSDSPKTNGSARAPGTPTPRTSANPRAKPAPSGTLADAGRAPTTGAGRSARTEGERREARWRARRQAEVEAEGGVWDPDTPAPPHIAAWAAGVHRSSVG